MTPVRPTLTPAYGRDYASKAAAEADLRADKDFIWNHMMDPEKPVSLPQLHEMGVTSVQIRYAKLRKVAIVHL